MTGGPEVAETETKYYDWRARYGQADGTVKLRKDRPSLYFSLDEVAQLIAQHARVVPSASSRVGKNTLRRRFDAAVDAGWQPGKRVRDAEGKQLPAPTPDEVAHWRALLVEHDVFPPDGKQRPERAAPARRTAAKSGRKRG
jgi:hypothetical protein